MSLPTYIGYCCREWILALAHKPGRCGYCGERPTYLRPDTGNPEWPHELPSPDALTSPEDSGSESMGKPR